jgi:hypothetical protein
MLEPNALKSSLQKRAEKRWLLTECDKDVGLTNGQNLKQGRDYLHPALLNLWAYILPISPIPIMPMAAVSFVNPILRNI